MMLVTPEPAPELPEGWGNSWAPPPVPAAGVLGWKLRICNLNKFLLLQLLLLLLVVV